MHKKKYFLVIFLTLVWLTACYGAFPAPYLQPQVSDDEREIIYITPQILAETSNAPLNTATADSEQKPQITPTEVISIEVPEPIQFKATLWKELPQVPILMYHRFFPQPGSVSYAYTTSLTDFEGHLNALYDAGYSLISLADWLRGEINLPKGRRPLIITIDDLFYGDQISLNDNGEPAQYSGIGVLWQFYQDHPDFNFHAALFFNLGDKLYANEYANGVFTVGDGWREDRAEAIAWCIKNGATPYNHFYHHPFLNTLSPSEILFELEENDRVLREDLKLIDKKHLAKSLPNIVALPYVVWPATEAGTQVIFDYHTPEGAPLAGIMEGDYAGGSLFFASPFADDFDPFHVPRISVSWTAINNIVARAHEVPKAQKCDLGMFANGSNTTPGEIAAAILEKVETGVCSEGYYSVNGWAFTALNGEVIQISP
jgi:hypothetical protein